MSRKVIAYDVGTTGIKTCLFEIAAGENIRFLGSEVADYTLRMLGGGAVEQDPEEWWEAMGQTTRRLLEHSGTAREEIQGISFCS
jgi:xylulokinase